MFGQKDFYFFHLGRNIWGVQHSVKYCTLSLSCCGPKFLVLDDDVEWQ